MIATPLNAQSPHTRRFDGMVALVTGGGSGIGAAVARRLAAEGARVAIIDLQIDRARAVAAEFGDLGLPLAADVTDETAVEQAIALITSRFGHLDVAVHAAGYGASAEVVDMTLEQWRGMLDVDLSGVFLCTKHAARQFLRQGGGGVVVNIASINAQQPAEGMSAYCVAKAGVVMFTQVAGMELAPHGVRVVGVGPGLTLTPLTAQFVENDKARSAYLSSIPAGRGAQPEEIAGLVAYLASPEAAYVNAETVYIDGGMRTRSYPRMDERRPGGYVQSQFFTQLRARP